MDRIDENVVELLYKIDSTGYDSYIVGGAIRDIIMGNIPDDYDICTNAPLDVIEDLFKDDIVDTTGKGLLSIKVKFKNKVYEITNTRVEYEYKKAGYPSKVELTNSIHEDLKRRDFTINALAYSLKHKLIDDYNSIDDINKKIIRTIGNPIQRFKEDPTRILRGIRFAICLNFEIEEKTYEAMKLTVDNLDKVPTKKIKKELQKILSHHNKDKAIKILKELNILNSCQHLIK